MDTPAGLVTVCSHLLLQHVFNSKLKEVTFPFHLNSVRIESCYGYCMEMHLFKSTVSSFCSRKLDFIQVHTYIVLMLTILLIYIYSMALEGPKQPSNESLLSS